MIIPKLGGYVAVSEVVCCDNMDFMAGYADNSFDIAIIDPQTGQGEDKKHVSRNRSNRGPLNGFHPVKKMESLHRLSDWDNAPPTQSYFDELFRVSRYQIIMCENYLQFDQKSSSPGRIVWNLLRDNDFSDCNIMWTNLFNRIEYFEFMWNGMLQGITINSRTQQGNKKLNQRRIHPSEKPYMVYGHLFKSYVKPGWSILDTHLGSGASRIVADKLGFNFYGCEKDAAIFTDQEKRYNDYKFNIFETETPKP